MQNNFFKLQEYLEQHEDEYISPYASREVKKGTEEMYRRDYIYYLAERAQRPQNMPYIHDYAELAPILSMQEIEEIVRDSEKKSEKETVKEVVKEVVKQVEVCSKCKTADKDVSKNDDSNSSTSNKLLFATARSQIPTSMLPNKNSTSTSTSIHSSSNINGKKVKTENSTEEIDAESNIDKRLLQMVYNEVMVPEEKTEWEDIAGLKGIKNTIKEIIIWSLIRPDIFTGLRGPPKALLLFGPPGTGKTLIGRCIASQSHSTFFSISASSMTSTLFYIAAKHAPAVVFIDEIDSLLMQRTEGENESTRRIKTEFLVQMDGAKTAKGSILVIGATNRPQEIDEAARRRFVKRLYVPLPDAEGRKELIRNIAKCEFALTEEDIEQLAHELEGYSGSDIFNLCREAAMEPIREVKELEKLHTLRKIRIDDFRKAMQQIRKSVSHSDLSFYDKWNRDYGSLNR